MFWEFNEIDNHIKNEAIDNDIDMDNLTAVRFAFLLRRCGERFKSSGVLFEHSSRTYNRFLVAMLIPSFLDVCTKYGVIPSATMFSHFSGISVSTFRSWIRDTDINGMDTERADLIFTDCMNAIYKECRNKEYINIDIYKILIGKVDSIKDNADITKLGTFQVKSLFEMSQNYIDDKLANSSQVVGAITLHNDNIINKIAESGRLAVTLQELPVLSLPSIK